MSGQYHWVCKSCGAACGGPRSGTFCVWCYVRQDKELLEQQAARLRAKVLDEGYVLDGCPRCGFQQYWRLKEGFPAGLRCMSRRCDFEITP